MITAQGEIIRRRLGIEKATWLRFGGEVATVRALSASTVDCATINPDLTYTDSGRVRDNIRTALATYYVNRNNGRLPGVLLRLDMPSTIR